MGGATDGKTWKIFAGLCEIFVWKVPYAGAFFESLRTNQISLWNLKNKDLYYEMEISVRNYFRLNAFRRKTQSNILLLEKHGLPFFFQKNKKRKAFFLGFFLGVLLLYVCSLFIWDIQIHGNHFYSQETVLETLEAFQIRDGILKKNVDCQKIAAKIRTSFPQVVWVSARNTGNLPDDRNEGK